MSRWLIVFFGLIPLLGFAEGPIILEMRLGPNIFDMEQPKIDCKISIDPAHPDYDFLVNLVSKVQQNPQLSTGNPAEGPDSFYQVTLSGVPTTLYLNNVYFEKKIQSDEAKALTDYIFPLCLVDAFFKEFEKSLKAASDFLDGNRTLGVGH